METFLSTSDKIQHIIKSFNLTKTFFVSSIIIGEPHTGKKSLARYLFPDATLVSGLDQKEVALLFQEHFSMVKKFRIYSLALFALHCHCWSFYLLPVD